MNSPDVSVPAPMSMPSMPVPILDPLPVSLTREAARPLGGEVQGRAQGAGKIGGGGQGLGGVI